MRHYTSDYERESEARNLSESASSIPLSRFYELLTGKTPFDGKELMASGLDAMRNTIREKEPVRPNTKLSQTLVAANVRRLQSSSSNEPATEEEVRASSRRLT